MRKTKSLYISRQVVWDTYKRVSANLGSAGVDQQEIMGFKKNLKDNL